MAWLVLVFAGVLEAVWAVALGRTDGFNRLAPSMVFLVAITVSMLGLAYAMRTLPVGTSYAVWVGIGAALSVAFGMITGEEPASIVRIILLLGSWAASSASSSRTELSGPSRRIASTRPPGNARTSTARST